MGESADLRVFQGSIIDSWAAAVIGFDVDDFEEVFILEGEDNFIQIASWAFKGPGDEVAWGSFGAIALVVAFNDIQNALAFFLELIECDFAGDDFIGAFDEGLGDTDSGLEIREGHFGDGAS